ncbi:ParA family protein, partial [Trichocoleus sp. FACHB-90]|nr:ParA family protein [Trichocoleus sp. FACHB-90]
MNEQTLSQALLNLPENAQESIVDQIFGSEFLKALGFEIMERVPQYNTGDGGPVDYALRRNTNEDIFLATQANPYLLLELKGRDV